MHLDSFIKQTAGGQLLTIVKEHYLRDDIEYESSQNVHMLFHSTLLHSKVAACACRCGSPLDPACKNPDNHVLSKDADHYLMVDTNVVLHQADFLEHESVTDVVILSTVYREVQHKNSSIFLRLKNLLKNNQKRFFYFSNEFHKVHSPAVPAARTHAAFELSHEQ
jgi:exosome complex exonuclease DIS3/RRP44